MRNAFMLRYGELALKGKNRDLFEKRLVSNIKNCLKKNDIVDWEIVRKRGRIFVYVEDLKFIDKLKRVFGLVSISPVVEIERDYDELEKFVLVYLTNYLKEHKVETFRIAAKRSDKRYELRSRDIAVKLGQFVCDNFSLKVQLKKPELVLGVEIHDKMYIYLESVSCFGGLPLGVSGKVGALIRNTADMYAAWLMMKRGASIFPIGKDINIDILEKYSYGQKLSLNLVSDDEIAGFLQENDCGAVVVGDFFEEFDMKNYEKYKTLVLAPLIAHDDNYVAGKLKKIS